MPFADVVGTLPRVFVGSQGIAGGNLPLHRFFIIPFEIRHTPAATGSSAAAVADLARPLRLMNADIIENFPLGDVEAVADGVVKFHVGGL